MKDEPVSDRVPFLGIGSYVLEVESLGRGQTREGALYSYINFKVLESDMPSHPANSHVTKWILDKSFSVQKDIKIAMAGIMNKPASSLVFEELVPFFYPETKREPEDGEVGTGTEVLAGRKVQVQGVFPKKKDGTISTYPAHSYTALDAPLDV
jgi:hypothetical protein